MKLQRTRSEHCASDFFFDRWLADSVTREERERFDAHLHQCTLCANRLASLKTFQEQQLHAHEWRLARAVDRPVGGRSTRKQIAWLTGIFATAAATAAALFALRPPTHLPGLGDQVRTKGGATNVRFFVRHDGDVRLATQGLAVAPSDQIQIVYSLEHRSHLAVVGLDDHGTSTTYYPTSGARALAVPPGKEIHLPHSIVLDDVGEHERIEVWFCDEAVDVESVRQASAAMRASEPMLAKPIPGCAVHSLSVRKTNVRQAP